MELRKDKIRPILKTVKRSFVHYTFHLPPIASAQWTRGAACSHTIASKAFTT